MGQCQHLFVATNSQFMVYIFSSFLRFFLIFQSTRISVIWKGIISLTSSTKTKGWKKPIIQTLYSGLKNASDFPLLFTLINFFCEPTETKFSILDNRKPYKKIWNIKKCIQRIGSSSTTCFTKNIQNRIVISNSNKRLCYWFRVT